MSTGYASKFLSTDFTSSAGFDTLVKRMEDGKATCRSVENFLRLRSKCDEDYSKALCKISRNMTEFNEAGTLNEAWIWMKAETDKMSRVHADASLLLADAATKLYEFQKQQKNSRKPKEDKVASIAKEKSTFYKKTMEAKRLYDQRSYEAEMAEGALKKAKVNENSFPTKEWDKIVSKSTKALQECTKSELTYKDLVTKLNEVRINWQKEHTQYCELCEAQDLERLRFVLAQAWEACNITSVNCVEDDKLVESMRLSLDRVKVDSDMALFVACHQTGNESPDTVRFELYQGPNDSSQNFFINSPNLPKLKDIPSGGKSVLTIKRQ